MQAVYLLFRTLLEKLSIKVKLLLKLDQVSDIFLATFILTNLIYMLILRWLLDIYWKYLVCFYLQRSLFSWEFCLLIDITSPLHRCGTILHPGDNCTVRIEKNKSKKCRKHKGSKVPTQNKVAYLCHFCSHQTFKRGTLKGHMKRIKHLHYPKSELQTLNNLPTLKHFQKWVPVPLNPRKIWLPTPAAEIVTILQLLRRLL